MGADIDTEPLQAKYGIQWVTTALNAPSALSCNDALKRLCGSMLSVGSVAEYSEPALQEARNLSCIVDPPALTLNTEKHQLVQSCLIAIKPENCINTLLGPLRTFPEYGNKLLAEFEHLAASFTSLHQYVAELMSLSKQASEQVEKRPTVDTMADQWQDLLVVCEKIAILWLDSFIIIIIIIIIRSHFGSSGSCGPDERRGTLVPPSPPRACAAQADFGRFWFMRVLQLREAAAQA